MNNKLLKIIDVLKNSEKFKWNMALYCVLPRPFNENSVCAVLDADQIENEDIKPDFVTQNKLVYMVGMHTVQDIVCNRKESKPSSNDDDLLEAFNLSRL